MSAIFLLPVCLTYSRRKYCYYYYYYAAFNAPNVGHKMTNRRRGRSLVAVSVIKGFEFLFESICSDVQVVGDNVR